MIRNKKWWPAACTRCHASLKPHRNDLSDRSSASLNCTSISPLCQLFRLVSYSWMNSIFLLNICQNSSVDRNRFELKTAAWKFRLMVNFHLSFYFLPSASPSPELHNSRAVKQKHNNFNNSALDNWVCICLSSVFTVRNVLWYEEKSSLIYLVNYLDRGTDLNRLLIS